MNQKATGIPEAPSPQPDHPEQPNPGMPGFAGQPPLGQPGQGDLKPDLMPPKEGEQRPD
jgi:hypothetical protein